MPLLHVRNLIKQYGSKIAVNNINLKVQEGRCVALLGPNGAGKTTTLNMIAGLTTPTKGTVAFDGMGTKEDIRNFIGYLPQYPSFYGWMTGKEFLIYVGKLATVDNNILKKRTDELLELVGLSDAKNLRISGYSGGMKQRLGIAQAMIQSPKLLILDEPVSALDPIGRREVLEMLRKLKQQTTVLFSTHILNDAEEISDDILIISDGRIVLNNSLIELKQEAQQPIIAIHFEDLAEMYTPHFKTLAIVSEIQTEGTQMKIVVDDISNAKKQLLKFIVEKEIIIQKFEIAQLTLEELFMKVVKQ